MEDFTEVIGAAFIVITVVTELTAIGVMAFVAPTFLERSTVAPIVILRISTVVAYTAIAGTAIEAGFIGVTFIAVAMDIAAGIVADTEAAMSHISVVDAVDKLQSTC